MTSRPHFFYQRRFSFTVIYIIAGVLFVSFPIMGMLEPTKKSELDKYEGGLKKLEIKYEKLGNENFTRILKINIENEIKKAAISNQELKNIEKSLGDIKWVKGEFVRHFETPSGKDSLNNLFINIEDLEKIQVELLYDDKSIKDLSINNSQIIIFKESSKLLYVFLTILGILWIIWQIRILIILLNSKPTDLYKD